MPAVLEVYTDARLAADDGEDGVAEVRPPVVSLLKQSFSKPHAGRALGTITVCDVDKSGAGEVLAWIADHPSVQVRGNGDQGEESGRA